MAERNSAKRGRGEPLEAPAGEAELQRLRDENRRLAVSLGGFSAFIASKGMLEEAWHFVHRIHEQEDGEGDRAA